MDGTRSGVGPASVPPLTSLSIHLCGWSGSPSISNPVPPLQSPALLGPTISAHHHCSFLWTPFPLCWGEVSAFFHPPHWGPCYCPHLHWLAPVTLAEGRLPWSLKRLPPTALAAHGRCCPEPAFTSLCCNAGSELACALR